MSAPCRSEACWLDELLSRYLVLLLVGVSLGLFSLAVVTGVDPELAVLAGAVLALGSAQWMQRRRPFRADWSRSRGDLPVDLASALVLVAAVDPLLKLLAPLAVVGLYATLDLPVRVSDLPLWLEIGGVLLAAEFGKYWAHRLHHQWAPLWWLHAMHHSSERLYLLNGLRFHPLNYLFNFALSVLPLMLLGVSAEALLGYLAVTQPVVLVQHANIDLRHGWLNRVFSTPEVHRWHHARSPATANSNFGNALLLWDHLFGTYRPAEGFGVGQDVGLFADSEARYPGRQGYLVQLRSMFAAPCCRS